MEIDKTEKLDLLLFQKDLNKRFLDIFEDNKLGEKNTLIKTHELGLIQDVSNYTFFFPLQDLKNITNDINFESTPLTLAWIAGFNQIRGTVFTVIDFSKMINAMNNEEVIEKNRKLLNDYNILYVKDQSKANIAYIIDNLNLQHIDQFIPLFKLVEYDKEINGKTITHYKWSLKNMHLIENNLESILKRDSIDKNQWNILENINNRIINNLEFSLEETEHIDYENTNEKITLLLIGDVYINKTSGKPIFVVDTKRLTKFLINVSPF